METKTTVSVSTEKPAAARRSREMVTARLTRAEWALLLSAVVTADATSTERGPLDTVIEELAAEVSAQVVMNRPEPR